MEAPQSQTFSTRRMKMRSRPNNSILYNKSGVDFSSTFDLLYPNKKIRLRLIKTRPSFYKISENPNVWPGIADSLLYNGPFALKDDYHKKRKDILACTSVEYCRLEFLAKSFITPARKNQFIQENY